MEYKPPKRDPLVLREAAVAYGAGATRGDQWIPAAEFKTHCLRLIDDVRQGRGEVVITRYGRPVARLVPYDDAPPALFGYLAGGLAGYGDLVSPVDERWEADD